MQPPYSDEDNFPSKQADLDRIQELEAEVEDLDQKLETAQAYNGEARIQELEADNERMKRNHNEITAPMVHDLKNRIQELEAALREIVNTPAEVEVAGECAYCESKFIARRALQGGQDEV